VRCAGLGYCMAPASLDCFAGLDTYGRSRRWDVAPGRPKGSGFTLLSSCTCSHHSSHLRVPGALSASWWGSDLLRHAVCVCVCRAHVTQLASVVWVLAARNRGRGCRPSQPARLSERPWRAASGRWLSLGVGRCRQQAAGCWPGNAGFGCWPGHAAGSVGLAAGPC
jgi:hypothetical protein